MAGGIVPIRIRAVSRTKARGRTKFPSAIFPRGLPVVVVVVLNAEVFVGNIGVIAGLLLGVR